MASGLSRFWKFGLQDLGALIIVLSCVVLQLEGLADDPGVGWHLLTGNHILDTGSVPDHDPFLYSSTRRPWIVDQWVGSTILAALYRIGGWAGLYAATTVVFLITFCGLLYWGLTSITGRSLGVTCAVIFAAKLAQIHFLIRPVVFGFFFFTLVFLWLLKISRAIRDDGESPQMSSFVGLFVLFGLWANVHGSFTLGLLLCSAAFVSSFVHSKRDQRNANVLRMLLLGTVCFGATLLTPAGVALYQKIYSLSTSSYFMSYHEEWLPPSLFSYEGQLFALVFLLPVFGVLWAQSLPRKLTLFEVLAFAGFLLLGFRTVRILPFFAIAATPVLAESLSLPFSGYVRRRFAVLARFGSLLGRIEERERRTARGVGLLIVVTAVLLPPIFGRSSKILLYEGSFGPSSSKFPVAAMQYLYREALLDDSKAVVCAPPEWGGFISLFGHGEVQPIIDDRNLLIGEAEYRAFYGAFNGKEGWSEYATNRGANFILFPAKGRFASNLPPEAQVRVVYTDNVSMILDLRETELVKGTPAAG
jgi:hypothetical protein